jgi:ATP-dependent Lhr-like helicase
MGWTPPPLIGINRVAEKLELPLRPIKVAVPTGDTPQRERQHQSRYPAEILVTKG